MAEENKALSAAKTGLEAFNNIDFKEVLSVAETIVTFIPPPISTVLHVIIKILKYLIKVQPTVKKLTASGEKITSSLMSGGTATNQEVAREAFEDLLFVAKSDGVITEAEKAFLWKKAQKAGISEEEFNELIKI